MIKNEKHGLSNTRIYKIHNDIKRRCNCINCISYKFYGERGIKICDDWKKSFISFYKWSMENGYSENLTIDRIDVNGNYEPSNCRWVGYNVQASNKRSRHKDGFKYVGIYNDKRYDIFDVNIKYKGKCLFRKYFKSLKDAVIERNEFIIKNKLPHKLNDTKEL